jgi:pyruvate/2-oxoglutarate/acetoin dehydrogenase E1 component
MDQYRLAERVGFGPDKIFRMNDFGDFFAQKALKPLETRQQVHFKYTKIDDLAHAPSRMHGLAGAARTVPVVARAENSATGGRH